MKKVFILIFLFVFVLSSNSFASFDSLHVNGLDLEIPKDHQFNVYDEMRPIIDEKIQEVEGMSGSFVKDGVGLFQHQSYDVVFDDLKVIVILAEPEEISAWASTVQGMSSGDVADIRHQMRRFSIDDAQIKNVSSKYYAFNGFAAKISQEEYELLLKSPFVKGIFENRVEELFLTQSAVVIGASQVWEDIVVDGEKILGENQTVCVIDTGIDYTHNHLGACSESDFLDGNCEKVVWGYDYTTCASWDEDGNCLEEKVRGPNPMDTNGHGTHVSGIIAANGSSLKGIAPKSRIVAQKALQNMGRGEDILQALDDCVLRADEYGITVISMSLGGGLSEDYCTPTYYYPAINKAVDKNISVVIATGNEGNTTSVSFPSCVESAIRVGSTTKEDDLSSFSNRWSKDMLVAPGSDISSTFLNNAFASTSGTSMATPHVSGAIALINQYLGKKGKSMSPGEINELLKNTSVNVTDDIRSYPRINVYNAINYLETAGGEAEVPIYVSLSLSKSELTFEEDNVSISWSASSEENLDEVNLSIVAPNESLIFSSSLASGEVVLTPHNLTKPGSYLVNLDAVSVNGVENSIHNYFEVLKFDPVLKFFINGEESNLVVNDSISLIVNGSVVEGGSVLELFLDDVLVDSGEVVLFEADFSVGFYEFTLRHNESEYYALKELTRNVSVINSTPQIESVSPELGEISSLRNESINFSQSSFDNNDLSLSYYWFVDGALSSQEEYFVFNSSSFSIGSYDVELIVSNGFKNNSVSWIVNLETVPVDIDLLSPANNSVFDQEITLINFSLSYADNVENCWFSVNEENHSLPNCEPLSKQFYNGEYYIKVFSNNSDGIIFESDTHAFEVINTPKDEPIFSLLFNGEEGDLVVNDSISLIVNGSVVEGGSVLELFLDDVLVDSGEVVLFEDDFSVGFYEFTLRHNESESFMFKEISSTLNVINSTPQINSFSPSSTDLTNGRDETIVFSHSSVDNNDLNLQSYWFVNGELIYEGDTFNFDGMDFDLGNNNVELIVSNGFKNNSVSWSIYLESVPIDISINSIFDGAVYESHNVHLSYSVSEVSTLDSCWAILNEEKFVLENCDSKTFDLPDGSYEVVVYANDTDGEVYSSVAKNFTINVSESLSLSITSLSDGQEISSSTVSLRVSLSHVGSVNYSVNDGSETVCFIEKEVDTCYLKDYDGELEIFVKAFFPWNNTLNKSIMISIVEDDGSSKSSPSGGGSGGGFSSVEDDEVVEDSDLNESESLDEQNASSSFDGSSSNSNESGDEVKESESDDSGLGYSSQDDVGEDSLRVEKPGESGTNSGSGFFSGLTFIIFIVLTLMTVAGSSYFVYSLKHNAVDDKKEGSGEKQQEDFTKLIVEFRNRGFSDFEISNKLKGMGLSDYQVVSSLNKMSSSNKSNTQLSNHVGSKNERSLSSTLNNSTLPVFAKSLSNVAKELGVEYGVVLKLKKYLNYARLNDVSDKEIKESLLKAGWSDVQIKTVLEKL